MTVAEHDVRNLDLADRGRARIDWALAEMPVLRGLIARFEAERPLDGVAVGACLHVTAETANLCRALQAGGARVALCASNPLSTQDDVAAALCVDEVVEVFARRGEDRATYGEHLDRVLERRPRLTLDDGGDLTVRMHEDRPELVEHVLGGTEETTTGLNRLRAMQAAHALHYPVVAVNDAATKHLFDNRYGTGQSTIDGILRATNFLLAGRVFTVAGYGWVGRGIAMRARGMGAEVIVTEVDPVRALEALMDGFRILPMVEAIAVSDLVVTATGSCGVVGPAAFAAAKDGCVLANAGHFDVEVDVAELRRLTVGVSRPRDQVEEFVLADGRRLRLLAEGRLVNLAAAEGHPAAVMDMSFANQALAIAWLRAEGATLPPGVLPVPAAIDAEVAALALAARGQRIDVPDAAQIAYRSAWREGT
jgi:adenosylhomocysteinase